MVAKVGENLFDGEAISATLPGSEGVFQILAGHEAFVSGLVSGEMHIKTLDGETRAFEIQHSGVAEVSYNQVTVLL